MYNRRLRCDYGRTSWLDCCCNCYQYCCYRRAYCSCRVLLLLLLLAGVAASRRPNHFYQPCMPKPTPSIPTSSDSVSTRDKDKWSTYRNDMTTTNWSKTMTIETGTIDITSSDIHSLHFLMKYMIKTLPKL